jgi:lysophospholipase L1-like esterase
MYNREHGHAQNLHFDVLQGNNLLMRHLTIVSIVLISLLLPAAASATRYSVAITGDSIIESAPLRDQSNNGLASLGFMVNNSLASKGIKMGGYGFVPMHASVTPIDYPWAFKGTWQQEGLFWFPSTKSVFGADGMPSSTNDPAASAQINLISNKIAILYGKATTGGSFKISFDNKPATTINTRATTNGSGIRWFSLSKSAHAVKIYGASGGTVRLTGLIASYTLTTGREVEVDQVGHGGDLAASNIAPPQLSALRDLRPKLTLIMFGSNEEATEMLYGSTSSRAKLTQGIVARAKTARLTGKCIVVPHAPNGRSAALQAAYRAAAQAGATQGRCSFAPALDGIWNGSLSQSQGLTTDGIHPTLAGYRLMSDRLATLIKNSLY